MYERSYRVNSWQIVRVRFIARSETLLRRCSMSCEKKHKNNAEEKGRWIQLAFCGGKLDVKCRNFSHCSNNLQLPQHYCQACRLVVVNVCLWASQSTVSTVVAIIRVYISSSDTGVSNIPKISRLQCFRQLFP